MTKLGKNEGDITCIPNNEEKYISFSKKFQVGTYLDKDKNEKDIIHEIRFLDSAKFMAWDGLAWDAALRKTEVKLQLLTDPDMLLMFEEGIRGRVSMITKRHGKANNPYMGEDFDPDAPTKNLAYLDANNLYGWAMCNPLPVGNFEWMSDSELKDWKKSSLCS